MFKFFDTGSYINELTLQEKLFGPEPTEVTERYVDEITAASAESTGAE